MAKSSKNVKDSQMTMHFRASFDTAKEASLVLLKKGTQEVLREIPFEETPFSGSVREACAAGIRPERAEYVYRVGNRIVIDPEAKLVLGRTPFGDTKGRTEYQVRCGFPKEGFDWGAQEHSPRISYEDTIAYYLHVRGFTMNKNSKVRHRGTFRGLEEKIPYLKDLGINQVVLMPAYEFEEIDRGPELEDLPGVPGAPAAAAAATAAGATAQPQKLNYWGYTKSWYFAPKAGYSASQHPDEEFKSMVRAMHREEMEVVMEFAFQDDIPADRCLRALIWWASEYHVDGFSILARPEIAYMAANCPELRYCKLMYGYFDAAKIYPKGRKIPFVNLANCNEGFKVDCRKLLKGDENQLQAFVTRVRQTGQDVAYVNYLCGHDGFTLMDLVSYENKHNEENGEQNRDGAETEFSWNCGAEGPTKKRSINLLRMRQMKNAFAMLLLSQGTPMILAGDEMGNSQDGNNNPYCIDSEVTWVDWNSRRGAQELRSFVKELIALRKTYTIFHSTQPAGQTRNGYPRFSCHSEKAWYGNFEYQSRHVGMLYCGAADGEETYLYVGWNFHWDDKTFALPYLPGGMHWEAVLDTAAESQADETGKKKDASDPDQEAAGEQGPVGEQEPEAGQETEAGQEPEAGQETEAGQEPEAGQETEAGQEQASAQDPGAQNYIREFTLPGRSVRVLAAVKD